MNWDTNELYLQLTNDERHYNDLKKHCRTAKEFKLHAHRRMNWINNTITNPEMKINEQEIAWNELYTQFCELVGNEHPKMNLT